MTDQLTPTDGPGSDDDATHEATHGVPPDASFGPPDAMSRADRVKSEIVAGGAVREIDDDELVGGWRGGLALAVIVALFVYLATVNIWIFVFVVGVVLSIFLHEFGHFITARWTGMKVTQFFLFFGPRLWSFRRGETEYGVRLIPLGAFVRIIGMNRMDDVDPGDEARAYRQKSFPRRMLVISAGSMMHMLIAVVLLFGVYATRGEITSQDEPRVLVSSAAVEFPAGQAGIEAGDEIISVGAIAVSSPPELGAAVRSFEPGEIVNVVVIRDGNEVVVPVGLGSRADVPRGDELFGTAYLGVRSYSPPLYEEHGIVSAAGNAVTDIVPFSWESTKGIVTVLNPVNVFGHLSGSNDDIATRPATLYGVATISDDIGQTAGLAGVLMLLAVLNVFIGVFNMFPLLPLDGGHAAIAVYERFREWRRGTKQRYFADVERLMPLAMGVIAVLLFVFVAGLYLEITDPIG